MPQRQLSHRPGFTDVPSDMISYLFYSSELSKNLAKHNRRPIRSFVRREGRITASQRQALETLWPEYGIDCQNTILRMDRVFTQAAPVSIDIGFGNGLSLLHSARHKPDWNHLGIEVHRPGIGRLCAQLKAQGLTNVRVICADAVDVLSRMIADHSIDRLLIFFPDPWPKKRHHKRRLIQPEFVQLMAGKLKTTGIVHLATDWQPYAQWMLQVMESEPAYRNLAGPGSYSPKPDHRPVTKFETRGKKLGHGVFDLIYERV